MPRIAIGVDTGKTQHQAAAVDSDHGRVLGQLRFRVDRSGFERFCAFVREQAGSQSVVIGLEATGHYHVTLLEFLGGRGHCVVLLNPYQVTQFRRAQGKARQDRSAGCARDRSVRGTQHADDGSPDEPRLGRPARADALPG